MLTKDAISFFDTATRLAEQLENCTPQAVYQWGQYPPRGRQAEIELLTKGALKREPKKPALKERPCCHHHPETKVS